MRNIKSLVWLCPCLHGMGCFPDVGKAVVAGGTLETPLCWVFLLIAVLVACAVEGLWNDDLYRYSVKFLYWVPSAAV